MKLPNFVIVGAPKCGTSSVYNWLLQHPDVCGARVKEPFFLMDADHPHQGKPNYWQDGLSAWSRCFPADAGRFAVRMEGTTHYLFQDTALRVLQELREVRVCVVLRDPAQRVLSSFNFTQNNLLRLRRDLRFPAYLELLRKGAALYPDYCTDRFSAYVLERDLRYSRYADYLSRWFEALGRERVKVLCYEDVRADPQAAISELTDWLGLPRLSGENARLEPRNQTLRIRRRGLHAAALAINPFLGFLRPVKPAMKKVYARLQGGTLAAHKDADLEPLRSEFMPDVRRLEALLRRDLSRWYPQHAPAHS